MSQDYISTLFDGLFFIIMSLLLLISSMFDAYLVLQQSGFLSAWIDFYPSLLWSAGIFLLGLLLYRLSPKIRQPLVFDRYS